MCNFHTAFDKSHPAVQSQKNVTINFSSKG